MFGKSLFTVIALVTLVIFTFLGKMSAQEPADDKDPALDELKLIAKPVEVEITGKVWRETKTTLAGTDFLCFSLGEYAKNVDPPQLDYVYTIATCNWNQHHALWHHTKPVYGAETKVSRVVATGFIAEVNKDKIFVLRKLQLLKD